MNEQQIGELKLRMEYAAFDEHVALAKLEEKRAAVRTCELEYERCRFTASLLAAEAKQLEKMSAAGRSQADANAQPSG